MYCTLLLSIITVSKSDFHILKRINQYISPISPHIYDIKHTHISIY